VRFYDRAEVKDALAWLKLLINPADAVSLRRVVNRPARGIGKTTVDRAEALAAGRGAALLEGLRGVARGEGGARPNARVRAFLELFDGLATEIPRLGPAEALARVLDRSGYLRALEQDGSTEAESRLENLRELLSAAEDFEAANAGLDDEERSPLELFLDQVALVTDIDTYDRREEAVSLMTAHMAKGLEFPVVFLVGMEEGVFPHAASLHDDQGIEEERRLCYVGMTRAMERLTLTSAAERMRFGSRSYGVPSRFLSEIPQEVLAEARGRAPARRTPTGPRLDYDYAQEAPAEDGGLGPGLRVRHPVFGSGTVLSVAGSGAGQKVRIQFERAGVKTVMVRFAQLEIG
jgi:DNA helicase-2/ATP-dependent DNA helicase PcrA